MGSEVVVVVVVCAVRVGVVGLVVQLSLWLAWAARVDIVYKVFILTVTLDPHVC